MTFSAVNVGNIATCELNKNGTLNFIFLTQTFRVRGTVANSTCAHLDYVWITVSGGRFLAAPARRMSGVRHKRVVLTAHHLVLQTGTTGRRGCRQVVAHLRHCHCRVEVPEHGQNRVSAHGFLARLRWILVQRQLVRISVVYGKTQTFCLKPTSASRPQILIASKPS